jgi:hypothetical protein
VAGWVGLNGLRCHLGTLVCLSMNGCGLVCGGRGCVARAGKGVG